MVAKLSILYYLHVRDRKRTKAGVGFHAKMNKALVKRQPGRIDTQKQRTALRSRI
jgi:hypothetical protein